MNPILSGLGRRLAQYLAKPGRRFTPTIVSGREARWQDYIVPGDVLLVEGNSRISTAIKYLTRSTWSHAAICVRISDRMKSRSSSVAGGSASRFSSTTSGCVSWAGTASTTL